MIVPLFALLDALFYLAHVPLCLAFCLEWRDGPRAGAGLTVFDPAAARRQARRRMFRGKARKKRHARRWRTALRILGRAKPRVDVTGRLCLGDAAATALACGGLNALGRALAGPLPGLRLDVAPAFDGGLRASAQGMVTLEAGHIITAAARCGMEQIIGRINTWKSAPSKPSCPPPWKTFGT